MTLSIKDIQFADESPRNPYFECAPFPELFGAAHLTFAVTVDDDGTGFDFWGQAVLPSDTRPRMEIDGASGRVVVSRLGHDEITTIVAEYLTRFDSWVALRFGGDLIFEDGE